MTLSTNYDVEYDGVIIASGDVASPYALISATLFGQTAWRSSDLPRGQQDGEVPGVDLYGGRDITMEIEVWAANELDLQANYLALLTAIRKRSTEKLLRMRLPGFPDLQLLARPRVHAGPVIDVNFSMGTMATIQVQFHCTDPRFYADSQSSGVATITSSTNGMTFPASFPLSFGGIGTSNSVNALNAGNYDTPWVATIAGPVTNPKIEHVESGKILSLVGTVNTGESLVVTSQPGGSIILNGTGSRYSWLQDANQWFLLQPGTNTVRFTGSTVGTPTLTLTWRSAWML